MADPVKSLVVKAGTTQQIPAADTLIVGAGIDASSAGALQIGASTATSIELKKDVSAAGDLAVDGAFDATGAASLASTLDVTGVANFAASIDVVGDAAVGGNLTVEGDLQVEGATTLVGTTQFQTDAEFMGNTTFGDNSLPDTVTFSANTIVSLGNNKIENLGAPVADADASTKKYVDDGLALKVAKAGDEMSGNLAMGGNKVTGLAAPSVDSDAANKQYVNEQDALKVSKSGDSMTGNLTMGGSTVTGLAAPAADSDAATKKYVDDADLLKLSRDGSLPMTGALNLDSHLISNVTDPVSAQDAATKKYTDDGLALKVAKAGDSMSGNLAMGANIVSGLKAPVDDNDAARKLYVDNQDALKVSKGGDSMTGALAMGANKITGLADPTAAQDAVTKKYADDTFVDVAGDTMTGILSMGSNKITDLAPGSEPADAVNFEQLQDAIANIDPAGSDGDIQFNADDVELGADEKLHWDRASSRLGLGFTAAEYASIAKQLDVKGDARVTGAFSVVGSASVSVDASIAGNLSVTGTASVTSNASVGGTFSATGNASFAADASIAANLKADGEFWIDAEAALPAGEAGYGKLAVKSSGDGVLYFIDGAGQAHYTMADGLDSSLTGPTPVLDLDPALPAYRSIVMSGNAAFTTDHRAAGRGLSLKLDNSAGASTRTLAFPAGWKWLGNSAPAELEASYIGIVSIVCYGSADSDIVAAWSYTDSVQITGAGTPGQVAFFDVTTRTITSEAALAWDKDNDLLTVGGDLSVGGDFDVAGAAAFAAAVEFAGAVSLTAAGSIDATLGMVDLPAEFKIDGSAVSADVSAENLNTLTAGPASDASALHSHPSVGIPVTAAGLASGDVVRITGASTVGKADADAIATARVAGIVGEANQLIVAGAALAKFKAGLTLAAGEPVYLSEVDAGELTNVAPTSGVVAEVGLVLNPAQTSSKALILVQVKAPIMLVA